MELCYYLLQYQKEAAFVLAAVHMDIVEVNVALLRFTSYASPEMLSQHGFPGSNFAGYNCTLSHFPRRFYCVAEVLVKKSELGVAMFKF